VSATHGFLILSSGPPVCHQPSRRERRQACVPQEAAFLSFPCARLPTPAKTNGFVSPSETNGFATRLATIEIVGVLNQRFRRFRLGPIAVPPLDPEPMKRDHAARVSGFRRLGQRRPNDKAIGARHCFHERAPRLALRFHRRPYVTRKCPLCLLLDEPSTATPCTRRITYRPRRNIYEPIRLGS
jgi:hypothetical protein